jgi:hypothetical protein
VAVRRWQTFTGKPAMLAETSQTSRRSRKNGNEGDQAAVANDLPTCRVEVDWHGIVSHYG